MDIKDRITGSLLGLAVGDALGMPYETGERSSFDVRDDALDSSTGEYRMTAYQRGKPAIWYSEEMPVGCWTDDTAMTLAEMESIARLGEIDLEDIMRNFCRWHYEGAFSATGTAIGQGRQTINALERFQNGTSTEQCGGASERDNGDGSLMRMLPFVFCEKLMKKSGVTIADLSSLTHAHPISIQACEIYVNFAREMIRTNSKSDACNVLKELPTPYDRLSTIKQLSEEEISSSGYVVHALEAALWCFLTTDNYADCVLTAINLGGDTDTIAAIAGALAGLYYGIDSIPAAWIDSLRRLDILRKMTNTYSNTLE